MRPTQRAPVSALDSVQNRWTTRPFPKVRAVESEEEIEQDKQMVGVEKKLVFERADAVGSYRKHDEHDHRHEDAGEACAARPPRRYVARGRLQRITGGVDRGGGQGDLGAQLAFGETGGSDIEVYPAVHEQPERACGQQTTRETPDGRPGIRYEKWFGVEQECICVCASGRGLEQHGRELAAERGGGYVEDTKESLMGLVALSTMATVPLEEAGTGGTTFEPDNWAMP